MAGFIEMPTSRRAPSSIDKLSDMGRELVEEMLADGKSYSEIVQAVKHATGEAISRSALSRHRITDFEPTRKRIEAAKAAATDLAALLRDDPTSVENKFDATAQGLFSIMLARVMEAKGADVTKLMREARMFQQVRNQVRRLENDRERIGIETEKLALERRELDKKLADFEARQAKAREVAGELAGAREITDEMRAKIREAYGL